MLDRLRLLFAKGAQGVCGGVEEIGVGFQQWSVAKEARKEDRVRSVACGHAILGPGEPAIHLHCPWICRWFIYKRPADEGSRGGMGGSLVVEAAALAAVSASSLPGIHLCHVVHRRLVGPGRAFRKDLRI